MQRIVLFAFADPSEIYHHDHKSMGMECRSILPCKTDFLFNFFMLIKKNNFNSLNTCTLNTQIVYLERLNGWA